MRQFVVEDGEKGLKLILIKLIELITEDYRTHFNIECLSKKVILSQGAGAHYGAST